MTTTDQDQIRYTEARIRGLTDGTGDVQRWLDAVTLVGVPALEMMNPDWLEKAAFLVAEALLAIDLLREEVSDIESAIAGLA